LAHAGWPRSCTPGDLIHGGAKEEEEDFYSMIL
jgi:hypothetical protein